MKKPFDVTRRDFLKILLAAGGGAVGYGILRTLRSAPTPYTDRIKNIVFFIQENHTFDSLFAGFPGANGKFAGKQCSDALHRDPPHKHVDALQPDGATSEEARCSYTEADEPNYWKAARSFTLCDNYFSDIRG